MRMSPWLLRQLHQITSTPFVPLLGPEAYNYFVKKNQNATQVGGQASFNFKFKKERVIKERLLNEGVTVQIHKEIAVVWGPYNLWVNDQFSHCGVDVFTLLKTNTNWKIASLAFSMETDGCDPEKK